MSSPSTPPSSAADAHREPIQHLIPTCHRCRRLRRKCDTQLPTCRVCEKANAECTFYDHALQQTLPRAHVHALLSRIKHLEELKSSVSSTSPADPQATATQQQQQRQQQPGAGEQSDGITLPDDGESLSSTVATFDLVISSTSAAGWSRYWGSSSVFALTVELLQLAMTKGLVSEDDVAGQNYGEDPEGDANGESTDLLNHFIPPQQHLGAPDESDVQALVHLYLITLNTLYGFVDQIETSLDLSTYLNLRRQAGFSPHALHGTEAHRFFRISMMCAISCANQARYRPQRTAECLAYYADAVTCVEEVTSEATPASLQALLLLIVFCLFYPRKGDIWKLLDYACRLTIELGYHTEEEAEAESSSPQYPDIAFANTNNNAANPGSEGHVSPASGAAQARNKLRRSTFWGLYAIERIVGQLFGRGSDLPETIITAEYPNSLAPHTGFSPLAAVPGFIQDSNLGVDQPTLQSMSIAHHYRLVYLRSEIFRTMYLPASPPDLDLDWFRGKYTTLYAWRSELAVRDDLTGVATLTCDVGYDATMCFLFQPLLLKALRATEAESSQVNSSPQFVAEADTQKTPMQSNALFADGFGHSPQDNPVNDSRSSPDKLIVASDPFYSAINLIKTYEKIIRAPERSTLGTYPMTFMSAHYIYLATSTLLAHAVLRLDGRVATLKRMCDLDADMPIGETEDLDWGAFIDASSSCLILLAWCVERWPGMQGMLGVYQTLFPRLIRELIGKALCGELGNSLSRI